ncbi:DNA polymerase IV [Gilvimarinus sp. SDUM040013]|uniref:DNA polymerase IV n=1 Tax=Gilvimarinus gilvus TaxID=3058038 RepID=A0ABU4RSV2_9GAMM|nr:DNA polymerase IV [Gilvimarinus sp. SDUM040013]MDO3388410.1 DNA polymerase IV [Gilvimarinus sp. SDUM040013]MDX6847960.1 DNA polymerase IV [Gilvimarinus sp. SDUM040013]
MNRCIIHIDADCFFAAVEMRDRPHLAHRPLAIGGSASKRGVISTCNYPARKFGVRSAMATAFALRLCPGLMLLPHRMLLYRQVSEQMMAIFHDFTDLVEPLSLDEAFLDVSACCASLQDATAVAEQIRARVNRELGITVSAGIAANKFLAKVASDWHKPDGLFVVAREAESKFLAELPVRCIPGVGKVTSDQLQFMGVIKCEDLHRYSQCELESRFGRFGARLFAFSRGKDDRAVKVSRERKSISVEQTYSRDILTLTECESALPELWQRLSVRLAKAPAIAQIKKGFVKIKFSDFSQTTLERGGDQWSVEDFRGLLALAYARGNGQVRLMGLGVRLAPAAPQVEQIALL